jgi:hypothetical protein
MYTAIKYSSNLDANEVDFSVGALASGPYRVSDLRWRQRMRGSAQPKLQGYGQWPTHRDPAVLEIEMEGSIVGPTEGDYWDAREALLSAIVPPADYDRTVWDHGTLFVTLPSIGQIYAAVVLADWDAPTAVGRGVSSACQFSWHADEAYWRLVSGGAIVRV